MPQAPRFGNGRTIKDLAKLTFSEVSERSQKAYEQGAKAEGRNEGAPDPRASAMDLQRAAANILSQMTAVSPATNATGAFWMPVQPAMASGSSRPRSGPAPKATGQVDSKTAEAQPQSVHQEHTLPACGNDGADFLSLADLDTLRAACKAAGVDPDAPDVASDARLFDALSQLGFPNGEVEAFLRRVGKDRESIAKLEQEAMAREEKDADDQEEAAIAEAEAEAAAQDGDEDAARLLAALKKAKEEKERKNAADAAVQRAIRDMGVCPMNFRWLRSYNGWRCAGGSHFISAEHVAAEMGSGKV